MTEKEEKMEKIRQEAEKCKKCELYKTRIKLVFGDGSSTAKIMIISEAPGYWEDQKGRPFVGKAGKILDELLDFIGLKREKIYIANTLKCHPPNNRNPTQEEIEACSPYLDKQIEIIKPKIICCLGNFATAHIMKKFGLKNKIQGISQIHGQVFSFNTLFGSIKIIPLYHPAVATYNINMLETLKKDFAILRNLKDKE